MIHFIDSYDHYQTAQIPAKYSSVSLLGAIVGGSGRCQTNCLQLTGNQRVTKGIPFSGDTGMLAFAYQQQFSSLEVAVRCAVFMTPDTQTLGFIEIKRTQEGAIACYRVNANSSETLLALTPGDLVRTGEYSYIEWKVVFDRGAGSVTIRINGVQQAFVDNLDTLGNATTFDRPTGFYLRQEASNSAFYDDLYCGDGTGPSPQNDLLGDVHAAYLSTVADAAPQDWGFVGAATAWQAVNDGDMPDGDASYIGSATVNAQSIFAYEDTNLPAGTIFGVQTLLYARKTDSGFRSIAPAIRSGGPVYLGVNQQPSFQSYMYLHQFFGEDPDTGVLWTIPGIDAAEFGVEITV